MLRASPKAVKRPGPRKPPLPTKTAVCLAALFINRATDFDACDGALARLYANGIFAMGFKRDVLQRNHCSGTTDMTQSTIRLTVNGRIHDVDAAADTALLYVLRNDLELNGPKYGCGLGECGACAVLIDGVAARSCVIPIEGCVGRDIVTLEGLGSRDHPDPVQQAFIAEQAAQCGYCLNGMIISTKALLNRTPHPSPKPRCMEALRYICAAAARISKSCARRCGRQVISPRRRTDGRSGRSDRMYCRDPCRWFARPVRARRRLRNLHQELRPTVRSPPSTAMSISAPAFAPRSGRSSPKNSTCPLRASSSCSAIPSLVPNQGATIASETIQITAVPLRKAAAQARHFLMARAAERLELAVEDLAIEDGLIRGRDNRSVSYGELIAGETIRLELADDVAVKAVEAYSIVGQSVPRIDLPAKATGELVYVHDVRVPGMLHGRVVRPPYAGVDAGAFVGTSLIAVDEASVRDIPGLVAVVRIGDFVGVIAEREENAIKAAAQLKVSWKPTPTLPDLKDIETALRANPSAPRVLIDKGDVDAAIAAAAKPMPRTYIWPYQMHGSIGPSCAVADYKDGHIRVWSGTQNPAHPAQPTSRCCCRGRTTRST